MDCLFCKIISGEIPSYTIYKDDDFIVFLDINPSTNGDLLVVPRKHFVDILEMDDELNKKMLTLIKKIYGLLKDCLQIDGLTIVQNNGFGQDIKHFHVHLTPRYENDLEKHTFNKDLLLPLEEVFMKIKNIDTLMKLKKRDISLLVTTM